MKTIFLFSVENILGNDSMAEIKLLVLLFIGVVVDAIVVVYVVVGEEVAFDIVVDLVLVVSDIENEVVIVDEL